jgi:hypothetical protein
MRTPASVCIPSSLHSNPTLQPRQSPVFSRPLLNGYGTSDPFWASPTDKDADTVDRVGVSSQGWSNQLYASGQRELSILRINSVSGRHSMTLGHEASVGVERSGRRLQGEETLNVLKDANHTQLLIDRGRSGDIFDIVVSCGNVPGLFPRQVRDAPVLSNVLRIDIILKGSDTHRRISIAVPCPEERATLPIQGVPNVVREASLRIRKVSLRGGVSL